MFLDSHAHLDDSRFDGGRDKLIEGLLNRGIGCVINAGADMKSSMASIELAKKYPHIYAAIGVHPHDAEAMTDDNIQELERMAAYERVVAIGEIGLDYYYDNSPRDVQKRRFVDQIELANRTGLPIIVHNRDAHGDTLDIIGQNRNKIHGGVMHCYSGSVEMMREFIDLGLYISLGGPVTFKNAKKPVEVAREVPLERLLIETDCPYLTPHPFRGKRNDPSYVSLVAQRIAEIRGISAEEVARVTFQNALDLFKIEYEREKIPMNTFVYGLGDALYINLTNRCTNKCSFCIRDETSGIGGYNLWLDREPTAEEIIDCMGDISRYSEIIFCGYGEPTIKLDELIGVAKAVKSQGGKTRINTNGQANLYHGENIVPRLEGLIDTISISLNAPTASEYQKTCQSEYGEESFYGVLEFAKACKAYIPNVVLSVVDILPPEDIDASRRIARDLGVDFRVRTFVEKQDMA